MLTLWCLSAVYRKDSKKSLAMDGGGEITLTRQSDAQWEVIKGKRILAAKSVARIKEIITLLRIIGRNYWKIKEGLFKKGLTFHYAWTDNAGG